MLTELPFQARHDGSGTQTGFAECAPGTFDSSCRVSQNFVKVPTRGEQGRVPSSFSFRELAPNITQTAQRAMWFCVGCPLCPFKTCYNFLAGQTRGKSGFRSSGDAVHPHRGQKATLDSLDLTCPRNPLCVSTDSAIGATSIRSGRGGGRGVKVRMSEIAHVLRLRDVSPATCCSGQKLRERISGRFLVGGAHRVPSSGVRTVFLLSCRLCFQWTMDCNT